MSGIQPSTLSDEEFERYVYAQMASAGALPREVTDELLRRAMHGGRDKQRSRDAHEPKQLNLPFDQ